MLAQTASVDLVEAAQEEKAAYKDIAQRLRRGRLLKAIRAFNAAVNNYTGGWQPQLSLELALIDILQEDEVAASPAAQSQPAPASPSPVSARPTAPATSSRTEESADDDFERASASVPGEPPAYSATKIHQGWMAILSRVYEYNKNIPPLLENAHVRSIEGNRLILGVENPVFVKMIEDPKRAGVLERAIQDLHQVKLRIEVRVVDSVIAPHETAQTGEAVIDDPLIAAGKELGGIVDE
jgi:hypothetical protein